MNNILNSSNAFLDFKTNDKFKINIIDKNRERKKFEKNIFKDALNGMFQIKTIDDSNLLNIITKENIIIPNYQFIKERIINIFENQLNQRNNSIKRIKFKH